MGTSTSFFELGAKLDRASALLAQVPAAGTEAGALLVKRSVEARLPSSKRLRGVGRRGAKIGVRYVIGTSVAEANAVVFATGAMQLIERDTSPHRIPKQRGSRARKRVIVIDGYGVRRYANHPGTKGQHPFEKGVTQALPLVPGVISKGTVAALAAVF